MRDILTNPKYTGHMVWHRRARNPVSEWIWSPEPVHEVLVDLGTFIQTQKVSGHRFGSRADPGANTEHPQTQRSSLFRAYLFRDLCGRRMHGKTRHKVPYDVCAPAKDYIPAGSANSDGEARWDHRSPGTPTTLAG
ncbi:recombinase family protein [Amycolatopsis sp.]|uniref:recombinase family protein n=1 Tax=Amycolatopsis sp. TaxID=37632 RepID=UPI002D80D57B|nr:recombinase family protein [Amycolatopsis sp.]HET6707968.1 recombinase family protein [Amycolatopsis sp.]